MKTGKLKTMVLYLEPSGRAFLTNNNCKASIKFPIIFLLRSKYNNYWLFAIQCFQNFKVLNCAIECQEENKTTKKQLSKITSTVVFQGRILSS